MIDNTWAAGVLFKALDFASMFLFRPPPNIWLGIQMRCWHCHVQCPLLGAAARECLSVGQMVDADTAYITSRGLRTLVCVCANIMKAV